MDYTGEEVHNIKCQYFDTLPPCNSLCIFKTGYLFAGTEFGNQLFLTFEGLGDDEEDPKISDSSMKEDSLVVFYPRKLRNIRKTDELESLGSIVDMKVADLINAGYPQIYTLIASG